MAALLRSEARKILSVPTVAWLATASIVFAAGTVVGAPTPAPRMLASPLGEQEFVLIGAFIRIFVVLIGVRVIIDELHHGTIVPTLTAQPHRTRVMVAKALIAGFAGGATSLLAAAVLLSGAMVTGHTDTSMSGFTAQASAIVGGFTAAGVLWAVLGVGLGALIRTPVAATVGPVAYLLLLEQFLATSVGERAATYLPGQGGFALALAPTLRHVLVGGAVLAGWALAATLAGTAAMERHDA